MKYFLIYQLGFIIGYLICFYNMDGFNQLKKEIKKRKEKYVKDKN